MLNSENWPSSFAFSIVKNALLCSEAVSQIRLLKFSLQKPLKSINSIGNTSIEPHVPVKLGGDNVGV